MDTHRAGGRGASHPLRYGGKDVRPGGAGRLLGRQVRQVLVRDLTQHERSGGHQCDAFQVRLPIGIRIGIQIQIQIQIQFSEIFTLRIAVRRVLGGMYSSHISDYFEVQ